MDENKSTILPKRNEINIKYKWKLEDIYESDQKWEEDFNYVRESSKEIVKFRGKLSENSSKLLECLQSSDILTSINDKLFVYARMRRDEDNSNAIYQALTDRAMALSTEIYAAISFIVPEIISIPEVKLDDFVKNNEGLVLYKQYIEEILRQKKHILSESEEELLALSSEIAHASKDIFTMFNNADIKFPFIKDEDGEEVEVTKGRFIKFLESKNRDVRCDAFKALYSIYNKNRNTLASMLLSNVKKNKFYATVRKYSSAQESSLDSDNISTDVYSNLIKTINDNLPLMHRYLKLRKKALNLKELHMYDLYVPIVDQPKKTILYDEAVKMVEYGLNPLGKDYLGYLRHGFDSGWVDVFENEGKTSGAYSWGVKVTLMYY